MRVVACMISLSFLLAVPSAMAQADKLIGVWKLVESKTLANPAMNIEASRPWTWTQPALWIFTEKYFTSVGVVRPRKPRPDLPENPTDAQIAEAYRQFRAYSGTYKVKGSTYTVRIIVHKDPNSMNEQATFTHEFRFEGDALIASFKLPNSPAQTELKYIRLE